MSHLFKFSLTNLYSPATERAIVYYAWSWGVRVALMLVIANIVLGVGLWVYAWYVPTVAEDAGVNAESLNETLLLDMTERMAKRTLRFELLRNNTSAPVDQGEVAQ